MSEIIYGIHAVKAMINISPERIISVHLLKSRDDKKLNELAQLTKELQLTHKFEDKKWLDKITSNGVHQGIVAQVKGAKSYNENEASVLLNEMTNPLILILDGITDPHNLGACIRSADAAGVNIIIMPKDKSAPMNATVKKVACGAAENIPIIRVTNLARTLRILKEEHQVWVVGTDGDASSTIYQTKLNGSLAIVMGAEGDGMRKLTASLCDELVNIPMLGIVSSLNVSVATGVCLFEAVRQRQHAK